MNDPMDRAEIFRQDAWELLADIEDAVLDLEADPRDAACMDRIFGAVHTIKDSGEVFGYLETARFARRLETLLEMVRENAIPVSRPLIDLILVSRDRMKAMIENGPSAEPDPGGVEAALDAFFGRCRPPSESDGDLDGSLPEPDLVSPPEGPSPFKAEQAARQPAAERTPGEGLEEILGNIRVPSARLDRLMDIVGEMGVNLSHLRQVAVAANGMDRPPSAKAFDRLVENLKTASDGIDRIGGDLRDCALAMRMLPIGTLFGKFRRLVRDLAVVLDKEIELKTEGGQTELDKSVIQRLGDPLLHLIRNAADHGVEFPEERARLGKPRRGVIRLKASHQGPNVVIVVEDDGRGIDVAAVRSAAGALETIRGDADAGAADPMSLVFTPGLSTMPRITDVSGRGIGMDVVQRQIEKLRGTVQITGEAGRACRVTLTLPLTLAISDGMLVRAGNEPYILPLAHVDECLDLTPEMAQTLKGAGFLKIRNRAVACVRLGETFGALYRAAEREQVVVVRSEGERLAIVVDAIEGTVQIVVKPLDRFSRRVDWISGGTILADGTVALIVDVVELARERRAPNPVLY